LTTNLEVGKAELDLPIQTARTHQRRVQGIGPEKEETAVCEYLISAAMEEWQSTRRIKSENRKKSKIMRQRI